MNDLIKTDNSKVIESLQNRVAELEATLESVNECFGELYVKKQIEKIKEQDE